MLNMETIIELAQRFGIKWKSPSTGIALSLLAGASLSIFLLTLQAISTETTRWTGVAAAILVFAFWLHTCRIPKNKPGKIGIALALQYETPEERKRIHADLVERISSRLASGESAHEFYGGFGFSGGRRTWKQPSRQITLRIFWCTTPIF